MIIPQRMAFHCPGEFTGVGTIIKPTKKHIAMNKALSMFQIIVGVLAMAGSAAMAVRTLAGGYDEVYAIVFGLMAWLGYGLASLSVKEYRQDKAKKGGGR